MFVGKLNNMILYKTIEILRKKYNLDFKDITIEDVRIGVFMTAVKLSNNAVGVASTTYYENTYSCKKDRDFGIFTPHQIVNRTVSELFEIQNCTKIVDTLKIAVINALSSKFLNSENYKIIENKDPVDLLNLFENKTITIVGAFNTYISKISETKNKLYVLELNENAFFHEHKKYYEPAENAKKIIPKTDILIITGYTLVNNTLNELMNLIPESCKVVITGPTSSIIPDVLFEKGAHIVGSTRINDIEKCLRVVSEAGTGFHLFKYCATKICTLNEKYF